MNSIVLALKRQWATLSCLTASLIISCFLLTGVSLASTQVTVTDNGDASTKVFFTTNKDKDASVEQFLYRQDYDISEFDVVTLSDDPSDKQKKRVSIKRAFPVSLSVAGNQLSLMRVGGTVDDLLKDNNVSVSPDDILNLPLSQPLYSDIEVVLQRVSFIEEDVHEEIPFQSSTQYSASIPAGTSQILSEGSAGISTSTYLSKYVDGQAVQSTLLSQQLTKSPVDETVLVGVGSGTSLGRTHVPLDEDGVPLQYTKIISGKSAGYSARKGAKTASGRPAIVGNVAVDPDIIPYGTKMYIKSSDSDDVYGYAIAADTGTALLDGRIIVDLFFGSYDDSCKWGIHQVDIFILP